MIPLGENMPLDGHQFQGIHRLRNNLLSKWETLFGSDLVEWMAFKPVLGLSVYPCYSCRHMFYSRKSFLDHINRRATVLSYKCPGCANTLHTFYNRCALLLHCRRHYSLAQGAINLNNLEVMSLDMAMVGFSKHPDVPYFFDVEEDYITDNSYVNCQFYSPRSEDKGNAIIILIPSNLVINRLEGGQNSPITLKQITRNIPKCEFITLSAFRELRVPNENDSAVVEQTVEQPVSDVEVKTEPEEQQQEELVNGTIEPQQTSEDPLASPETLSNGVVENNNDFENLTLPIITKIETVEEFVNPEKVYVVESPPEMPKFKCTECLKEISGDIKLHFLGDNRPVDSTLQCSTAKNVCSLICPTMCSLKAHKRVHKQLPPFVCPDCGIEFLTFEELSDHMQEICFHLYKSVRLKCPGRRCGKIFATEHTFEPHFRASHIVTSYQCYTCKDMFPEVDDCQKHCLTHEDKTKIVKYYHCPSCLTDEMTLTEKEEHIEFHRMDPTRRLYIYMCKACRGYFRSIATMSTHIQNCKFLKYGSSKKSSSKSKEPANPNRPFMTSKYISGECTYCRCRMIVLKGQNNPACGKCCPRSKKPEYRCTCILCKKQINMEERRRHQKECKYARPQVVVEKLQLPIEMLQKNQNHSSHGFNSSTSDLDGSTDGSYKTRRDSSDDGKSRKRQKVTRPRKPEVENDLTADEPIIFDGTYNCIACSHQETDRTKFQEHVKGHRTISTAYQCMECGECFVVKPSLVKHLTHYHDVRDCEEYFTKNDCFDKGAVMELAKVVKAPYLANAVKENQCRVCLEQFQSKEMHDKHFRIHGMAFLMTKSLE